MAGLNGPRGPGAGGGPPSDGRSPAGPLERPSASKGTDTPEGVERYLAALVARALHEDPEVVARAVAAEREVEEVEALQQASGHRAPGTNNARGVPQQTVNRQIRRARRRRKRTAKVVADMIERARKEGADPNWKPEAFPELDWRIRSEVWAAQRDVTGKKARILAAGLPPAQGEQLVAEAKRIAEERGLEDGFRTQRWRELVAGAWASWRLARPVRARDTKAGEERAQLGDEALGYVPPPIGLPAVPVKRKNPWSGGRVVDGYAREAFCLLMRSVQTGECMSISKLFYVNGSGTQGVFGYLATPAPESTSGVRSRAIDGVLGLYSRWQPPAWKSKFVGPPKRGPDGQPLLDKHGHVQRYALSEHWYHARMCGRRAAAQTDRGNAAAEGVLRALCPWLFEGDKAAEQVLEELAEHDAAMEGGQPPSPGPESGPAAADPPGVEPPD